MKLIGIGLFMTIMSSILVIVTCGGDRKGDGDGEPGISYTGLTTLAIIDENNAEDLVTGAYGGGDTGASVGGMSASQTEGDGQVGHPLMLNVIQVLEDSVHRVYLEDRPDNIIRALTTETASGMVYGDCGGSASYTININTETGKFSGNYIFNDYCSLGVVFSGSSSFSGVANVNTGSILTFSFSFDNLTCTSGIDSFTLSGDISFDDTGTPTIITMNMLMSDNSTGKVYWVKDYTMNVSEGMDYVEFEVSGYYYDPDYGYVVVSTTAPFVIYYSDYGLSEGVLSITGDTGFGIRILALWQFR
jgi:hypothetical protein